MRRRGRSEKFYKKDRRIKYKSKWKEGAGVEWGANER